MQREPLSEGGAKVTFSAEETKVLRGAYREAIFLENRAARREKRTPMVAQFMLEAANMRNRSYVATVYYPEDIISELRRYHRNTSAAIEAIPKQVGKPPHDCSEIPLRQAYGDMAGEMADELELLGAGDEIISGFESLLAEN